MPVRYEWTGWDPCGDSNHNCRAADYIRSYRKRLICRLFYLSDCPFGLRGTVLSKLAVALLIQDFFFQLHVKLIHRISFIGSLIADGTLPVILILINNELTFFILVNTKGTWLLIIPSDEKACRFFRWQMMIYIPLFQFFYRFGCLIGCPLIGLVDAPTIWTFLIRIINPAIAILTLYFHTLSLFSRPL